LTAEEVLEYRGLLAASVKRRVCVVLVDRANYGRLKPVMTAIRERRQLELQVVTAGTMVLERFGEPSRVVENDGFSIDAEVYIELEGSKPITMAIDHRRSV
jgi:hypothetical protein